LIVIFLQIRRYWSCLGLSRTNRTTFSLGNVRPCGTINLGANYPATRIISSSSIPTSSFRCTGVIFGYTSAILVGQRGFLVVFWWILIIAIIFIAVVVAVLVIVFVVRLWILRFWSSLRLCVCSDVCGQKQ